MLIVKLVAATFAARIGAVPNVSVVLQVTPAAVPSVVAPLGVM